MHLRILLFVSLFHIPATALATPPDDVLDALDTALKALSDPAVVSSYQLTTAGSFEKPNGKDRKTFRSITKIIPGPDGSVTTETIMEQHDEDVVTVGHAGGEFNHDDDDGGGGHGAVSFELIPPSGEDLDSYVYGETVAEGAQLRANFSPTEAATGDGLAHGTVWWSASTGKPTKLQFIPVKNPQFLLSLSTMFEFGRTGDVAHMTRIVSSGLGGIPGFKRKFAVEMVFDEVLPAG